MTSVYQFEQERLKPLAESFLNTDFDFDLIPAQYLLSMRLVMIENIPFVTVSDGYHNLDALFTKDAINEFRKNYQVKFSALRDKILLVTKYRLRAKWADSKKDYMAYQNVRVQLVIESFKPILHETPCLRRLRNSKLLCQDPEFQILLRHKRHQVI